MKILLIYIQYDGLNVSTTRRKKVTISDIFAVSPGRNNPSVWVILSFFNLNGGEVPPTGGKMKKVGIVMGSDSDMPVAEKAIERLNKYGVPCEVHIYSAHRTPEQAKAFAENAEENGFGAIIAFAGKAAHLAGALAANTLLPVIGVPVKSSTLDGLDALLSTVQMPSGIPVATVAIDGAVNAAILAAQIIATGDAELMEKLKEERREAAAAVLAKDAGINS